MINQFQSARKSTTANELTSTHPLPGSPQQAALRCLDHDERFAAVRGLEQEAKVDATGLVGEGTNLAYAG